MWIIGNILQDLHQAWESGDSGAFLGVVATVILILTVVVVGRRHQQLVAEAMKSKPLAPRLARPASSRDAQAGQVPRSSGRMEVRRTLLWLFFEYSRRHGYEYVSSPGDPAGIEDIEISPAGLEAAGLVVGTARPNGSQSYELSDEGERFVESIMTKQWDEADGLLYARVTVGRASSR